MENKESINNKTLTNDEVNAINDPISNENSKYAITTKDNPYDPFTQFRDWLLFDESHNYCTCSYLARICNCSDLLSDEENNLEKERAIDEIIKYDFMGIYKKVENKNYKTEQNLD